MLAIGARLAVDDGDPAVAARYAADAYAAALGTRDQPIIAAVGSALADIGASRGDAAVAAEMLGAAAALRGAEDPTAIEIVRISGRLRAELGEARL